jgi:hypothetical protein
VSRFRLPHANLNFSNPDGPTSVFKNTRAGSADRVTLANGSTCLAGDLSRVARTAPIPRVPLSGASRGFNFLNNETSKTPANVLARMSQKQLGDPLELDAKRAIDWVRRDKEGLLKAHPNLDFRKKPTQGGSDGPSRSCVRRIAYLR